MSTPVHPDLVVVGASAGGVEALRDLCSHLLPDLPACVLVVLHLPRSSGSSLLPEILQRCTSLTVRAAVDGEPLVPGTVLVAPNDRHLMVVDGRVRLTVGPRENGQRPAIDATLRSAAVDRGPRTVGVVLTGNLDDGSAGLRALVRHGGLAVVQDPEDAMFPSMPRNALLAVPDARVVALAGLPGLLDDVLRRGGGHAPREPDTGLGTGLDTEVDPDSRRDQQELATLFNAGLGDQHPGTPSALACPDCHGVLFEIEDGPVPRYRCRVGHAWSARSLLDKQDHAVETALWMALRTLEERASLSRRVAESAVTAGRDWSVRHFASRAEEAEHHAATLRRLLSATREGGPAGLVG